jgi:hypothetical protein
VPVAQLVKRCRRSRVISVFGVGRGFNQPVCNSAHGGHHDYHIVLACSCTNDRQHFPDARGIAYRRAAEFYDAKRLFHK